MNKLLLVISIMAYSTYSTLAAAETSDQFAMPVSSVVTVSFPNNSSLFRPASALADKLANINEMAMVTINGRTSTSKPSAKDESLALARAVSARAWLIAHGVSPLKIMINYASAADYAADNSTPEGKQINQRTDIEIIYVPAL